MTDAEYKAIIDKLSEKLPDIAVQRTKGTVTYKGYDTTGYGYQYCVDRFNDVLGAGWGYSWRLVHEIIGTTSKGKTAYNLTAEVSIWIGDPSCSRSCVGGHSSSLYEDALKGAITNAFKKTAAFWGVGADAYRGQIDDDNLPIDRVEIGTGDTKGDPKEVPPESAPSLPVNAFARIVQYVNTHQNIPNTEKPTIMAKASAMKNSPAELEEYARKLVEDYGE